MDKKKALFWAAFALLLIGAVVMGRRSRKKPAQKPATIVTTDAAIYLSNLDGQITELERLLRESPKNDGHLLRLSGLHHLRGRYRDDLDEIQLGIELLAGCVEVNANCRLARAEQEQSLHRFGAARADVDAARAAGADRARVADLTADLNWNDGKYDQAIAAIRKARVERPSSGTWMREAQLEHDLGDDDASDRAFEKAASLLDDTAPLPYSHLDVQRGIQKHDRGQLEEAARFFRSAATRMPTYVAGNEHLAETLAELGRDDEAISIYERVTSQSSDPEFAHALAKLYRKNGRASADLEEKAKSGYAALLSKYPEAMYWHAAEFYSDIGDGEKAYELLVKNVALRPNSQSYVALARAQLATNRPADARASLAKARAMPVRSRQLAELEARDF